MNLINNKSSLENIPFEVSSVSNSFRAPYESEIIGYQTVSIIFGVVDAYLLFSLLFYEKRFLAKPPGGRSLRMLCVIAVSVAVLHQVLQQVIVASANNNTATCFALMLLKTTIFNLIVSSTYGFLWLRQHTLYSSPRLKHLRSNKMNAITWTALGLIIVNPMLAFGFQFRGSFYEEQDGVCLVLLQPLHIELPFHFISFSYGIIQVKL